MKIYPALPLQEGKLKAILLLQVSSHDFDYLGFIYSRPDIQSFL